MLNRSKDLYKIGVDVGGTFTDIVIYDESNSKLFEEKLSQETFAGDVMKDKMPGGETRLFLLPSLPYLLILNQCIPSFLY